MPSSSSSLCFSTTSESFFLGEGRERYDLPDLPDFCDMERPEIAETGR